MSWFTSETAIQETCYNKTVLQDKKVS